MNIQKGSALERISVKQVSIQPTSRLVFHTDPRGPGADRFRFFRMRLQELSKTRKVKRLLVTSPLPHEGKSTVALNLATALAERGNRTVLLVEGDLHHPYLSQVLGLETRPGLAECLESALNPISAAWRLQPLSWYFLPAGRSIGNVTELLQSEALSGVMQTLIPHFDWILIDSPPVAPLTDALELRAHADASLLVVRAGHTSCEAVEDSIRLLGRDHVLGIILNGVEGLDRIYSKYCGHYGYCGGEAPKGASQTESDGSATGLADGADHSASHPRRV